MTRGVGVSGLGGKGEGPEEVFESPCQRGHGPEVQVAVEVWLGRHAHDDGGEGSARPHLQGCGRAWEGVGEARPVAGPPRRLPPPRHEREGGGEAAVERMRHVMAWNRDWHPSGAGGGRGWFALGVWHGQQMTLCGLAKSALAGADCPDRPNARFSPMKTFLAGRFAHVMIVVGGICTRHCPSRPLLPLLETTCGRLFQTLNIPNA